MFHFHSYYNREINGGNNCQQGDAIEFPMTTGTTDSTTDSSDELPQLPFVTTSDVLNQLNHHLQQLSTSDNAETPFQARFELQKRLPDGSAIPATPADLAYSDLQTKLDQSAKLVASLADSSERARWAEEQRKVGNAYFYQANYQAAMDIYLTCLVVKEDTGDFVQQTLLPVLNNLAQCTLQLGMHKKTIEFSNIALEEIEKYNKGNIDTNANIDKSKDDANHPQDRTGIDALTICKVYFKRAKARRLTGWYKEARQDLNQASRWLDQHRNTTATTTNTTTSSSGEDGNDSYQKSIQKEFRYLEAAETEARKNRQKQKQSLQKALLSSTNNFTTANNNNHNHGTKATTSTTTTSSRGAIGLQDPNLPQPPRQYSTLRKRKPMVETSTTLEKEEEERKPSLSFFQYYCLVVTRVTELLLLWLGDEETKEEIQKRLE